MLTIIFSGEDSRGNTGPDSDTLNSLVAAIDFAHYEGKKTRPGSGLVLNRGGDLLIYERLFREVNSALIHTREGDSMPVKGIFSENRELKLWKARADFSEISTGTAEWATALPKVGDTIYVLNPWNRDAGVQPGTVVELKSKFKIKLLVNLPPGLLGAPVFDSLGRVTGLITDISIKTPAPYAWVVPVTKETVFKEGELLTIPEWKLKLDREWRESPKGMWHAVNYYLIKKDYDNAIPLLEKITEKTPEDANGFARLGFCLGQAGRFDEAVAAFERLIELQPDRAINYFNLGQAYAAQGKYTRAAKATEKAVDLEPKNSKAHYNLGVIYMAMEDKEGAMKQREILQTLNQDLAKKLYQLHEEQEKTETN